jgi:hypothetical protein
MHSTCGSVSSSRGCLEPHPPVGIELSTGMLRGSRSAALLGVVVPGVDGGVNAGERRDAGGACVNGVDVCAYGFGAGSSSCSAAEEAEAPAPAEREKSACSTSPSLCDVLRASGRGE